MRPPVATGDDGFDAREHRLKRSAAVREGRDSPRGWPQHEAVREDKGTAGGESAAGGSEVGGGIGGRAWRDSAEGFGGGGQEHVQAGAQC